MQFANISVCSSRIEYLGYVSENDRMRINVGQMAATHSRFVNTMVVMIFMRKKNASVCLASVERAPPDIH